MKLQVADLNSFYGPAHILFDIALDVGEGEVVALLGRNGAGKSTTFRSIVGLVENRSGRIVFEGKDVSREPTHAHRARRARLRAGRAAHLHRADGRGKPRSRPPAETARTRRSGRAKSCSRCFPISAKCATAPAAA